MREEEVRAEHWGDLSVEWEKPDRPLELGERVISLEGGISELKGYWEDRELSEGREDKESDREIELENNLRLLYLFLCG